jgi:septal ring factor EnvC (AmiA/AmiB activator)
MTPDQINQVIIEAGMFVGAVFGNGHLRKRTSKKQIAAERAEAAALKTESELLRKSLTETRDKMVRLEVRIEASENSDERVSKEIERLRVEMHSLGGRVDASNALYTEILQKAKERAAQSAQSAQSLEATEVAPGVTKLAKPK